jgi:hypothetical protein
MACPVVPGRTRTRGSGALGAVQRRLDTSHYAQSSAHREFGPNRCPCFIWLL